jgi:hypothetical protein
MYVLRELNPRFVAVLVCHAITVYYSILQAIGQVQRCNKSELYAELEYVFLFSVTFLSPLYLYNLAISYPVVLKYSCGIVHSTNIELG